jgi:hypothetical protein
MPLPRDPGHRSTHYSSTAGSRRAVSPTPSQSSSVYMDTTSSYSSYSPHSPDAARLGTWSQGSSMSGRYGAQRYPGPHLPSMPTHPPSGLSSHGGIRGPLRGYMPTLNSSYHYDTPGSIIRQDPETRHPSLRTNMPAPLRVTEPGNPTTTPTSTSSARYFDLGRGEGYLG